MNKEMKSFLNKLQQLLEEYDAEISTKDGERLDFTVFKNAVDDRMDQAYSIRNSFTCDEMEIYTIHALD